MMFGSYERKIRRGKIRLPRALRRQLKAGSLCNLIYMDDCKGIAYYFGNTPDTLEEGYRLLQTVNAPSLWGCLPVPAEFERKEGFLIGCGRHVELLPELPEVDIQSILDLEL